MRQFLSWRFWLAIGGVLALFALLLAFVRDDDTLDVGPADQGPQERTVDLVAAVATPRPSDDFEIVEGVVRGSLDLVLDDQRTMRIHPGTLGADDCGQLPARGACTVVADLLGDAVVWFTLVPTGERNTISLPPISSFPRPGWALLDNGWEVPLAQTVARVCEDDTTSLGEFVRRFGRRSTTTVDLGEGRITRVTCAAR